MPKLTAELKKFKNSLPAMAVKAADAAAAKSPMPWGREVGQDLRHQLAAEVDRILAEEYGSEPIAELREIADDALIARCDEIFHAWHSGGPRRNQ